MKLFTFLFATSALLAQSVNICPTGQTTCAPVFAGSGLNDATVGGTYTGVAANHYYTATLSSTGTPDQVTFSRDGGAATAATAITGSAQRMSYPAGTLTAASWATGRATYTDAAHGLLSGSLVTITGASPSGWNVSNASVLVIDSSHFSVAMAVAPSTWTSGGTVTGNEGVTITWAATTGHTAAAAWTANAVANGSLNAQTFVQRGIHAVVARNSQEKMRDEIDYRDFPALCNGVYDDTNGILAAMNYVSTNGGGTIQLPNGAGCKITSGFTIGSNVSLDMRGGQIIYAGSSSASAQVITMIGNYPQIRNGTISTGVSGAQALVLQNATFPLAQNVHITGATATTGFATGIHITGDGISQFGFGAKADHVLIDSFTSCGLCVDHALSTDILATTINSAQDGVTATDVILDHGTSGISFTSVILQYGHNGMLVEDTAPTNTYGRGPNSIFGDALQCDTVPGGDCIKFDASLGLEAVPGTIFLCNNCWALSGGLDSTNTVITPGAVGLGIYGGTNYRWVGGRIAANALDGVLVNGSSVNTVAIDAAEITANNQSLGTGYGIRIQSAADYVSLTGNQMNNGLGLVGSGGMIDGIYVDTCTQFATVIANNNIVTGSNLNPVNIPCYSATGSIANNFTISGNGPATSNTGPWRHALPVQPGGYLGALGAGNGAFLQTENSGNGFFNGPCGNLRFEQDGNWHTTSDGGSNGGFCAGTAGDYFGIFNIHSTGTAPQTISNAAFQSALSFRTHYLAGYAGTPLATFASLPACNSTFEGFSRPVADSTTRALGAIVTGGGTDHVEVYCDSSQWVVKAAYSPLVGNAITQLSGSVIAIGPGSVSAVLNNTGVPVGTWGDSTHVPIFTTLSDGRLSGATSTLIPGVTVNAGTGLSGGGTVALGGSITINNTAATTCSAHTTTSPALCTNATCTTTTTITYVSSVTCP